MMDRTTTGNIWTVAGVLLVLLFVGMLSWAVISAKKSRDESVRANVALNKQRQHQEARTKAWLRWLAGRHAEAEKDRWKAAGGRLKVTLPGTLPTEAAADGTGRGYPPFLTEVRAVLTAENELLETPVDVQEKWRNECLTELEDTYRMLVPAEHLELMIEEATETSGEERK